jgi:hypothetical protein
MKCVILQPSYLPWRGFFHQIQKADVFMFYDDVQYDARGWRNRNRIKTPDGTRWITVPVFSKGGRVSGARIMDVRIRQDQPWARKHWETIRHSYGRAPHFERYAPLVQSFFERRETFLADFTIGLITALASELGLGGTRFMRSSELGVGGAKTERLLGLLDAVGADVYLSGPSARAYLDEERLAREGVRVEYMEYDYPEYEQLHPPYDARISILDLLFMQGPAAPELIWGSRTGSSAA